ncbi:MAG: hypothetical protein ACKV2V_18775, partial [Blastocatellia bacterium]
MNCDEFAGIAHELTGDTRGAAGTKVSATAALAHAMACPACHGLLTRQRALDAGLQTMAAASATAAAPAHVKQSLRAAFAAQHATPAQPVRVESGGGALAEWRDTLSSWLSGALTSRWIPAAALAALILLAMGTTLYNSLVYREATPDSAAQLPMPTPSVETPRPIINNTIDKPAPR